LTEVWHIKTPGNRKPAPDQRIRIIGCRAQKKAKSIKREGARGVSSRRPMRKPNPSIKGSRTNRGYDTEQEGTTSVRRLEAGNLESEGSWGGRLGKADKKFNEGSGRGKKALKPVRKTVTERDNDGKRGGTRVGVQMRSGLSGQGRKRNVPSQQFEKILSGLKRKGGEGETEDAEEKEATMMFHGGE